jgi:hypothetical protein
MSTVSLAKGRFMHPEHGTAAAGIGPKQSQENARQKKGTYRNQ